MAKAKKRAKKPAKITAVPKGYHTVTISLVVRNAADAIEFYKKAFGAKERSRSLMPDGRTVMHSELTIGDSVFMLSDEFPQMKCLSPQSIGGTSAGMYVYVKDADKVFNQALAAGAYATMPLMDAFWGDRTGQLKDPFGHIWSISTRKRNLSRKEMEKAAQQWASSMQ